MSKKANNPYLFENIQQFPLEIQKQMIAEVKAMIPNMTPPEQADMFDGAPSDIILDCLPSICSDAQVKVWRKYLPVGARDKAKKVLSYDAKVRVGLVKKEKRIRWTCLA